MALNPTLRLMVDNAHARYAADGDPVARKRAEIMERQRNAEEELCEMEDAIEQWRNTQQLSVSEQLIVLGLRKASKKELQAIILNALVEEAAA